MLCTSFFSSRAFLFLGTVGADVGVVEVEFELEWEDLFVDVEGGFIPNKREGSVKSIRLQNPNPIVSPGWKISDLVDKELPTVFSQVFVPTKIIMSTKKKKRKINYLFLKNTIYPNFDPWMNRYHPLNEKISYYFSFLVQSNKDYR